MNEEQERDEAHKHDIDADYRAELTPKPYHEVGCRQCGDGGKWKVYFNGSSLFIAKCSNCGHKVLMDTTVVVRTPDPKPIDLRFVV